MAGSSNRCYLLELPRELRDLIYGHVHKKCAFPDDPDQFARQGVKAYMLNGPRPLMLRVCQQIRQEYAEVAVLELELLLQVRRLPLLETNSHLETVIAGHWMRAAASCTVAVTWPHMMLTRGPKLRDFGIAVQREPEEQTLQRSWTPSKEAVQIIAKTLETLSKAMKGDFRITIVTKFPQKPEDMVSRRMFRLLQPQTFTSLMGNLHLPFSRKNKLMVVFTMTTPVEDNGLLYNRKDGFRRVHETFSCVRLLSLQINPSHCFCCSIQRSVVSDFLGKHPHHVYDTKPRLLSLPVELRHLIYDYLYTAEKEVKDPGGTPEAQ